MAVFALTDGYAAVHAVQIRYSPLNNKSGQLNPSISINFQSRRLQSTLKLQDIKT